MNKIYHDMEAQQYENEHPEIFEQLPPLWEEMIQTALDHLSGDSVRILDFGCGTGFEIRQFLRNCRKLTIDKITCYDLSHGMIKKCQENLKSLDLDIEFTLDFNALKKIQPYNVFLTNSLIHHLPNYVETIDQLTDLLSNDAVWLAGHEPSTRFYQNVVCRQYAQKCAWSMRIRKLFHPRDVTDFLLAKAGLYNYRFNRGFIYDVAETAYREGLFLNQPSPVVIGRLVDFSVAHSQEEIAAGRGLDFEILQEQFQNHWKMVMLKTYSFMGVYYEKNIHPKYQKIAQELSLRYPNDGNNFSCVWKRV
ncbi:MAG TPA: class I SAM-dependent methyltransferase [bacterium]|nr:class I SAM-dependent methyltransferase [bacterium]